MGTTPNLSAAYYGGPVYQGKPSVYLPTILREPGAQSTATPSAAPIGDGEQLPGFLYPLLAAYNAMGIYQGAGEWFQGMRADTEEAKSLMAQAQAQAQAQQGRTTQTTRGTAYATAPSGVDPQWYRQFQQEHGGQTPEQYYAQTGEDIGHALADEEWGRQFEQMYGRPPTEDDWRYHWFVTRTGSPPPGSGGGRRKSTSSTEQRPPLYEPPMIIWR